MATKSKDTASLVEAVTESQTKVDTQTPKSSGNQEQILETKIDKDKIRDAMQPTRPLDIPWHLIKPGHNPKWVNDEFGQIQRKLDAGYSFVKDSAGKHIKVAGYPKSGIKDMDVFLLQCPKEVTEVEIIIEKEEAEGRIRSLFSEAKVLKKMAE